MFTGRSSRESSRKGRQRMRPTLHAIAALLLVQTASADTAGVEFFEKRVRPVLAEHCYPCHGRDKKRSGLTLDGSAILEGGDRGLAIVPGKPDASLPIQVVRYAGELRMPPRGKLKEAQIADLAAWVKMGAPVPRDASERTTGRPAGDFDLAERRRHWAYSPVRPVAIPVVKNAGWCSSP